MIDVIDGRFGFLIIIALYAVILGLIIAGIATIANKVRGKYKQKATASNASASPITNELPKSPILGFVLSLFLGWIGADRFYMGGTKSIIFGVIKIVCGVIVFLGCVVFYRSLVFSGRDAIDIMQGVVLVYSFFYLVDLVVVPFSILDRNRKIANVPNNPTALKDFGKWFFMVAVSVCILGLWIASWQVLIELLRLDIFWQK